jgi:glycosyltransferase involved in cell wall biosynthesis
MTGAAAKITVFTPSFADESDANAQNLTVKEVVSRLCPERFRVLMLHEGDPDPRIAHADHVRLLRWRRRGNTARCLGSCLRQVPDIYFFPREGPLDAAFLHLRRLLRLRTRVITYVVSGGLDNGKPRPKLDRNVREADAVYGNCKYLSEIVYRRWKVRAGTIYDGVDRRFYYPNVNREFRTDSNLVILFAGSLRSYKRPEVFVRSAARWPKVQFRVAGVGEEEQRCRSLAGQMGCRNVSFLGHLSSSSLGEEMRRADVFLFPSTIEGHPQVLGQAAACGLPAIAMKNYQPEFVIDRETGFLVDSDDELNRCLDLLLRSPELRQKMSYAAAEHSRRFEWDEVTRSWEHAFQDVLAPDRHCAEDRVHMQVEPR